MKPFNSDGKSDDTPASYRESALNTTDTGLKTKTMRVCTNCEQPGHTKQRCFAPGGGKEHEAPDWYIEKSRKKTAQHETVSLVRQEACLTTVPATISRTASSDNDKHTWIVNSGATAHKAKDCNLLTTLHSLDPLDIKSASTSSQLQAIGCGTVQFNIALKETITTITLHDILYCPNLSSNLLSLRKVIQSGAQLDFSQSSCNFSRDGIIFAKACAYGELYIRLYLILMENKFHFHERLFGNSQSRVGTLLAYKWQRHADCLQHGLGDATVTSISVSSWRPPTTVRKLSRPTRLTTAQPVKMFQLANWMNPHGAKRSNAREIWEGMRQNLENLKVVCFPLCSAGL